MLFKWKVFGAAEDWIYLNGEGTSEKGVRNDKIQDMKIPIRVFAIVLIAVR
jgi:hypothetical protein